MKQFFAGFAICATVIALLTEIGCSAIPPVPQSVFCVAPNGQPFFQVDHAPQISWYGGFITVTTNEGKKFTVSGTCVVGDLKFMKSEKGVGQ